MANLTHHNHRNNIQKNISDFSNRKKKVYHLEIQFSRYTFFKEVKGTFEGYLMAITLKFFNFLK